jgi:hypothetical protein
MYNLFNKELGLGHKEPIVEKDFARLTSDEHVVWDAKHPEPEGGDAFEKKLMRQLADESDYQLAAMSPEKRQVIVQGAWSTLIGQGLPDATDVSVKDRKLHQKATGSELPLAELSPKKATGATVVWVDGKGKNGLFKADGKPIAEAQLLVDSGSRVIAADLFQQGEFLSGGKALTETAVVKNPRESAAYTHGYNHSVFARRTQDILSLIVYAKTSSKGGKVYLIGTHGAGPLVAAASALAGNAADKIAIATDGFRFENITSHRDPNFIPGAVKYGDLPGLVGSAASHDLWIGGEDPASFKAAQALFNHSGGSLTVNPGKGDIKPAIKWLIGK